MSPLSVDWNINLNIVWISSTVICFLSVGDFSGLPHSRHRNAVAFMGSGATPQQANVRGLLKRTLLAT